MRCAVEFQQETKFDPDENKFPEEPVKVDEADELVEQAIKLYAHVTLRTYNEENLKKIITYRIDRSMLLEKLNESKKIYAKLSVKCKEIDCYHSSAKNISTVVNKIIEAIDDCITLMKDKKSISSTSPSGLRIHQLYSDIQNNDAMLRENLRGLKNGFLSARLSISPSTAEKITETNSTESNNTDKYYLPLFGLPAEIGQKVIALLEDRDLAKLRLIDQTVYHGLEGLYEKKAKSLYDDARNTRIFKRDENENDHFTSPSQKINLSYGGAYYKMKQMLDKAEKPSMRIKRACYAKSDKTPQMLCSLSIFIAMAAALIYYKASLNEDENKYLEISGVVSSSLAALCAMLVLCFKMQNENVEKREERVQESLNTERKFFINQLDTLFNNRGRKETNDQNGKTPFITLDIPEEEEIKLDEQNEKTSSVTVDILNGEDSESNEKTPLLIKS